MAAQPISASESAVRAAVERLSRVPPGAYHVVSCYLKLEPRDKTRGKYLIKIKNRIREALAALQRQDLERAIRGQVAADLERVHSYFGEPTRLPPARGIALFACGARQAKRGNMLAGGFGEHNYHMRIREERQRHYARVADRIFQIHTQRPVAGLVVAGIGVDAAALLPHLHTYLHDLVLGVVRLNPKRVTAAEVREAALSLREERERAWERAHAEAVREGVGTGWALNGVDPTLKALQRGQVRTLLADGQDEDLRIDDAIEEALAQRVQVDVVYDERARRVVDGLAGLLRVRR